jgi:hypothetical protein
MTPARVAVHRADGRVLDRAKAPNARELNRHGTTACFAQRCRCKRCRLAASTSERVRRAEIAVLAGRAPLYWCSTAPMARHVAELRAAGWTLKAIALAAGLNVEAFRRALRKGSTSSDTVRRVLAVG